MNVPLKLCLMYFRRSILQDRSLRSSTNSATRIKRTSGITKVVISEFAACSKKACGYAFCTNCNCDRHINAKCTKRPLGSSPKSDEDSPYKPEPRHTKRDLRRLGRLVFWAVSIESTYFDNVTQLIQHQHQFL